MQKVLLLLLLVSTVALTKGQELCLAEPMVELNVNAVVRSEENLCEDNDFQEFLREGVMDNYEPPPSDDEFEAITCHIQDLTQVSCIATSHRNRRRVIFGLRANLTCGSNGCSRAESNRESFAILKSNENALRTAMRFSRKVTFYREFERTLVRVRYFNGKKTAPFDVCRDSPMDSIRGKLTLCSCPSDCPEVRKPEEQCSGGMQFNECGSACPPTCDNPPPIICTTQCVPGCSCPSGTVEHEGACINPENCPSKEIPTDGESERECSQGMMFTECGSACPPTCDSSLPFCVFVCVKGCFCPFGMVEFDGACISPESCPNDEDPTDDEETPTESDNEKECFNGMQFNECGSACPPTCENQPPFCTLQCVPGCFCPFGMVEFEGACISPESCPNDEDPTDDEETPTEADNEKECSNEMEFNECGSACPPTCENQSPFCTFQCVPGCFCPFGMVEFEGACVSPESCPKDEDPTDDEETPTESDNEKECSNEMEFNECGSACPPTCENQSPFCTLQCVPGCVCPSGMVLHGEGCIAPESCPGDASDDEEQTEEEHMDAKRSINNKEIEDTEEKTEAISKGIGKGNETSHQVEVEGVEKTDEDESSGEEEELSERKEPSKQRKSKEEEGEDETKKSKKAEGEVSVEENTKSKEANGDKEVGSGEEEEYESVNKGMEKGKEPEEAGEREEDKSKSGKSSRKGRKNDGDVNEEVGSKEEDRSKIGKKDAPHDGGNNGLGEEDGAKEDEDDFPDNAETDQHASTTKEQHTEEENGQDASDYQGKANSDDDHYEYGEDTGYSEYTREYENTGNSEGTYEYSLEYSDKEESV